MNHETEMHQAMFDLMNTLASGAVAMDALADDLVEAANAPDGQPISEIMRGLARRHRVEALQLQGKLAALTVD